MGEVTPIPGSIVKAVCAVKSTLEAVKKSQKNVHGNYMFSSADDIYAAITRKMGEVGLLCVALEEDLELKTVEKEGKVSQWLKVSYSFVLATEDATWSDPRSRRTLFVQVLGPQTFQAAQSYAEKSYYRSLFSIPTGDMDLDSLPEGFEYNPVDLGRASPPPPPPPPADKPSPMSDEVSNSVESTDMLPQPTEPTETPEQLLKRLDDELWLAQDVGTLNENWAHFEGAMEDTFVSAKQHAAANALYVKHEARINGQSDMFVGATTP